MAISWTVLEGAAVFKVITFASFKNVTVIPMTL